MKNNLTILTLFLICAVACLQENRKEFYQPKHHPNYRVVLEFDLPLDADKQAMLDSARNVTIRRLEDVFYYSDVSTDPASQTVTIDLIGMNLKSTGTLDTMLPSIATTLANEGLLEFFDTYSTMDEGLLGGFVKTISVDSIFRDISIGMGGGLVFGYVKPENILKFDKKLQKAIAAGHLPEDLSWAFAIKPVDMGNEPLHELYFLKGQPKLTGSSIIKAEAYPSKDGSGPVFNLTFDAAGTKKWAKMTTKASQNGQRSIAVVFNGNVLAAPAVISPITDGKSVLSSGFNIQETITFSHIFQSGQLPGEAKVLSAKKLK